MEVKLPPIHCSAGVLAGELEGVPPRVISSDETPLKLAAGTAALQPYFYFEHHLQ
jgi:hypothetical protein